MTSFFRVRDLTLERRIAFGGLRAASTEDVRASRPKRPAAGGICILIMLEVILSCA